MDLRIFISIKFELWMLKLSRRLSVVSFSAVRRRSRFTTEKLWTKCRDFSRIIFHSRNRSSHLGTRDIALADSDESTVLESILESSGSASVFLSVASRD